MLCIKTKTKNINTSILQAIIQKLKPTFCVNDMMPSHLLKQAFDCVSPSLMHLINIRTIRDNGNTISTGCYRIVYGKIPATTAAIFLP